MITLKESSLDWALAHALKYGDTDVFPPPFEYRAIEHDWENVRSFLHRENILEWKVRPNRAILAPKGRHAFRLVTQLDPLDFLVFAATVLELASELERRRVPTSQDTVFSYRFQAASDGQIFNPRIGYSQFQHAAGQVLEDDVTVTHVATADIADFYSRIYLHRLENALNAATGRASHVRAIMRLLAGWNETETYGIPVGGAPSRLLAEITLSDVDEALLANGIRFIRFNDDYRLFATSYAEAYRHIAFLADVLCRNHGLTLQPQKTTILEADVFRARFLPSLEDRQVESLRERFRSLVEDLELSNSYAEIEYDDLPDEQRDLIDSMHLPELFREEAWGVDDPDPAVLRFLLRRLGQLGDASVVEDILEDMDTFYPVFPEIIEYFSALRNLSQMQRHSIGSRVLNLLEDSIVSELEYHRMWALDLFTHSTEWDNESRFFTLLGSARDQLSRRKLILAMGRAGQRHWFQSQWRNLFNEPHWPRRALLAAASCMPPDATKHWYRSVEPRLDPLEKAVMRWARLHPFR